MKYIATYLEDQRRFLVVLEFMELPFHEETLAELLDREHETNESMKIRLEEMMKVIKNVTRTMEWTQRLL